jgi:hypothetical protein
VLVVFTLNNNVPIDPNIRIIIGIIVEVSIVFLAVVLLLIPFLRSSEKFRTIRKRVKRKPKWQSSNSSTSFEAHIHNRKQAYVRGMDSLYFRSRFRGSLTNGFLFYKIYAAVPPGVDTSGYLFRPETPNVDGSWRHVIFPHPDTADVWSDRVVGKLNGDVDTGWLSSEWKIPKNVHLGIYIIEMSVANNFVDYKQSYKTVKDTIHIIDPDNSNHPRFDRVNV